MSSTNKINGINILRLNPVFKYSSEVVSSWIRFSASLIRERDEDPRAAFFTTNYHVFRAGIKAREANLPAEGMGAATKWYFWPNAAVREFIGLLTEHRTRQILILLLMIAAYTALTLLALT